VRAGRARADNARSASARPTDFDIFDLLARCGAATAATATQIIFLDASRLKTRALRTASPRRVYHHRAFVALRAYPLTRVRVLIRIEPR